MIRNHLLLRRIRQILHTSLLLLQIDVAQPAIEQHLARIQLELQPQLLIVDTVVPAEIEQCVVEVGKSFLEVAHEEVGYALLEVCDGEVPVQLHSALIELNLRNVSANPSAPVSGIRMSECIPLPYDS